MQFSFSNGKDKPLKKQSLPHGYGAVSYWYFPVLTSDVGFFFQVLRGIKGKMYFSGPLCKTKKQILTSFGRYLYLMTDWTRFILKSRGDFS